MSPDLIICGTYLHSLHYLRLRPMKRKLETVFHTEFHHHGKGTRSVLAEIH
jgi:hypothetical protein